MIKNAFLQRISERPLNVTPAIDWNNMKFNKYYERKKRRENKPALQQIVNILHCHPCYFLNMYKHANLDHEKLLDFLKIIYRKTLYSCSQHLQALCRNGVLKKGFPRLL